MLSLLIGTAMGGPTLTETEADLSSHTLPDDASVSTVMVPTGCRPPSERFFSRPVIPNRVSISSTVHPITVWYDSTDSNNTSRAPEVLAQTELSWDIQVGVLGFREPHLPDAADGPDFDIYLGPFYFFSAYVQSDNFQDQTPGDGYNGTSSFMVFDNRIPVGQIPGFIAHEFNHACQWNYDYSEFSFPVWEGTSTAAQKWTLGAAGAWDSNVVNDFQVVSYMPTLIGWSYYILPQTTGFDGYYFEYGAAMWVMWIDEKFGVGDGTMGPAIWDAHANEGPGLEPDIVDAFGTVTGMDWGEALAQFAVARFLTGDDWDSRGIVDAELWGGAKHVPALNLDMSELPLVDYTHPTPPMVTGQVFFDIDLTTAPLPTPAPDTELYITASLASANGLDSGITLMWWDDAGGVGDAVDYGATPTLEIPAAGLTRVVAAVTNLGDPGWDADDNSNVTYSGGDQLLQLAFFDRPLGGTPTGDTGTPAVLLDCDYEGTTYAPGDEFPTADDCNTCTCDEAGSGAVTCTQWTCPPDGEPDDTLPSGGDVQRTEGCGCTSGSLAPGLAGALVLLAVARRRPQG